MTEPITQLLSLAEIQTRIAEAQGGERPERPKADPHPWDRIDLGCLPDVPPPEATIMTRTDGKGLIYPGTRNLLFAPFESSKTWVSLLACKQIMVTGGSVLYVDFESSARAIANRLRQMGVTDFSRFGYIRPTLPVDQARLDAALDELVPDLVVIDACAEAMVTHDLDENSNSDFMKFSRLLIEPLEERGHATLLLDHLGKAQGEEMKKYPRGASAKMATISGAALRIEVEIPFRRGFDDGLATIYVAKDREGSVRSQGTVEGKVAELRLATYNRQLFVDLDPPGGVLKPAPILANNSRLNIVPPHAITERLPYKDNDEYEEF